MGRIRVAMLWVAILGTDFAVLRHLVLSQNEAVLDVALSVLTVQVCAWFLFRGPTWLRGFSLGVMAIAAAWVMMLVANAYAPEDSWVRDLWVLDAHRWAINEVGTPFQPLLEPYVQNLFVLASSMAVISFVPQLATALIGGIVAQGFSRLATRLVANCRATPNHPRVEPSPSNAYGVSL